MKQLFRLYRHWFKRPARFVPQITCEELPNGGYRLVIQCPTYRTSKGPRFDIGNRRWGEKKLAPVTFTIDVIPTGASVRAFSDNGCELPVIPGIDLLLMPSSRGDFELSIPVTGGIGRLLQMAKEQAQMGQGQRQAV